MDCWSAESTAGQEMAQCLVLGTLLKAQPGAGSFGPPTCLRVSPTSGQVALTSALTVLQADAGVHFAWASVGVPRTEDLKVVFPGMFL